MSSIKKAAAYANNAVVLIAWSLDAPIPGCLGFEVTRIYVSGGDDDAPDGSERPLAAWVPFDGQSNPDWKPQTTSVWPVQKLFWRDLTVRQRRDRPEMRTGDVTVKYRIRPVVKQTPGLDAVPAPDPRDYEGEAILLSYVDAGIVTDPVTVSIRRGAFQTAFNNGILSTQWLKHAFESTLGHALDAQSLKAEIAKPESPFRAYLGGDVPDLLRLLLRRTAQTPAAQVYLSLYELTDPVLLDDIKAVAPQAHLILANSGKGDQGWDDGNAPFREELRNASPALAEQHDRLFNNTHIGHNKFAVWVDPAGNAQAVLTGSTNWTPNGLCAQSNNALIVESPELAAQYLAYWQALKADTQAFTLPDPPSASGHNVQSQTLRTDNASRLPDIAVDDCSVTLWRAPNTRATSKGRVLPPDLAEVYSHMRRAEQALFFAVFMPSLAGQGSIVGEAIDIGRKDGQLLVYGSVSDPRAMPNYVSPARGGTENDDDAEPAPAPRPHPTFDEGNVHVVQAAALFKSDVTGNFEAELARAGFAIIHDKIVVIDPLSENCVLVLGSHNLGFKASYANDENLLIVRGNRALAAAYAVHMLDLYEHYRFRAVQAALRDEGRPLWQGFLSVNDAWQAKYITGWHSALVNYLT